MPNIAELNSDNTALDPALLFIRDVLELTASTHAKVRAAGSNTLRRRPQDLNYFSNYVCRMLLAYFNNDTLACNAIRGQNGLAVVTSSDGLALMARPPKFKREPLRRALRSGRLAVPRGKSAVFLSAGFHGRGD